MSYENTPGQPDPAGPPPAYPQQPTGGQTTPYEQPTMPYGGQTSPYGQPATPWDSAPGQYGVPYGGGPWLGGDPPPTRMALAVIGAVAGILFSTILGLPCGLVAIRYARLVRKRWGAGDQPGAAKASSRALTWAIISLVLDALGVLLFIYLIAHGRTTTTG